MLANRTRIRESSVMQTIRANRAKRVLIQPKLRECENTEVGRFMPERRHASGFLSAKQAQHVISSIYQAIAKQQRHQAAYVKRHLRPSIHVQRQGLFVAGNICKRHRARQQGEVNFRYRVKQSACVYHSGKLFR